ncbi:hypothetical protein LCGC14_1108310 [marine sediment metagenome]|uniref:Uncharacterized protein n=1 Tax=marine sediment metagenome TaxID=412755 RepID=A0A0F9QDT1_9ZZZZ
MNRRNFFKTVTGFIAGVFTTSAIAKEKPKLTVAMVQKAKKYLDAQTEDGDFLIPVDEEYHPIFSPLIKKTNEILRERGIEIPPIQKGSGRTFFMDTEKGDDKNNGISWDEAIRSWEGLNKAR